jgi:signal transduction histidine kinase
VIEEEIKSLFYHYTVPNDTRLTVTQTHPFITDVKQLRIVFGNLISNAIKYSQPDQATPSLRLSFTIDKHLAIIEVADNGIGIHPLHIDRVFDMFYRATDELSGSGLKLYTVKSIIEKLGGVVTVTFVVGKGSVFKIILPNRSKETF